MAEHELPADIKALSFEDALKQLEELVRQLEKGESRLDDAIKAYERGANLKKHCEAEFNNCFFVRLVLLKRKAPHLRGFFITGGRRGTLPAAIWTRHRPWWLPRCRS